MAAAPLIEPSEAKSEGHKRCLVIDDERVIADTIAIILNQSGYRATSAHSGEESIEIAKRLKPSFVITDLIMAGINGIEAAIRIRQIVPDCIVLVYSGEAATADLLELAHQEGNNFDVFARQVHPRQLLEWLNKSA